MSNAENKLVKTITDSATLIGSSACVGYIGKKALKESFIKDPSSDVMNYAKWVAVLAGSMYLKDYLETQNILLRNGLLFIVENVMII